MNLKLPMAIMAFFMGKLSGVPFLSAILAVVGYEAGALISDKEVDGEKVIKGIPSENSSFPNFRRALPNSIKWTSASSILLRMSRKKDTFYINSFSFADPRTKSHFSFFGKRLAKRIEKKPLYRRWSDLKKGSLIV
jgi:hypothetical protein